ncbi:MAG: Holliday junction resolvase RuvX [bacterium]
MVSEDSKARQGSLLGVDYGRRRVGVAACPEAVSIAFGVTTLVIRDRSDLLDKLLEIIAERSVREVILGVPITLSGKPGTLAAEILELAEELKARGIPVRLVDEALSSRQAAELLRQRGKPIAKADTDRASATLLLQEYLDGHLPEIPAAELRNLISDHTHSHTL